MAPFVVVFQSDSDAFWCFERLMRKVVSCFFFSFFSSSFLKPELYFHRGLTLKVTDHPLVFSLNLIYWEIS